MDKHQKNRCQRTQAKKKFLTLRNKNIFRQFQSNKYKGQIKTPSKNDDELFCFRTRQNKTKSSFSNLTYLTDKQNLNLTSLSIHLAINSIENY